MRILLLSAYDADSHRRWHQGLRATLSEHDWTLLTLPPRHFGWRIRGNSLSWAMTEKTLLSQPYDLVVATSMVDIATLKGMVPGLAMTPTLLYFHENQFAYPASQPATHVLDAQMVTLYGALAADTVVFNSNYNRGTFLAGVDTLLARMPDAVPEGVSAAIAQRSTVLPVGLDSACFYQRSASEAGPLTLLWNHRWEHDKGPDRLLVLLTALDGLEIDYCIHIVGQRFRSYPPVFNDIHDQFAARIGYWGFVADVDKYRALLRSSDVVIATTLHDFQGLAVLEATAGGCIPVLPDRLCYRQWFDDQCLYDSYPDDAEKEAQAMAWKLQQLAAVKGTANWPAQQNLSTLAWAELMPAYREVFQQTVAKRATISIAGNARNK